MSKLSKKDREEYAHKAIEQAADQLNNGKEEAPPPPEENPDDDDIASLNEKNIQLKSKIDASSQKFSQQDAIEEVNTDAWEAEKDAQVIGNSQVFVDRNADSPF